MACSGITAFCLRSLAFSVLFSILYLVSTENELLTPDEYHRRFQIRKSFLSMTGQSKEHWVNPHSSDVHNLDLEDDDFIPLSKMLLLSHMTGDLTNNFQPKPEEDSAASENDLKVEPAYNTDISTFWEYKDQFTHAYLNENSNRYSKLKVCVNEHFLLEQQIKILFGKRKKLDMCMINSSDFGASESTANKKESNDKNSYFHGKLSDSEQNTFSKKTKQNLILYKSKSKINHDRLNPYDLVLNPNLLLKPNLPLSSVDINQLALLDFNDKEHVLADNKRLSFSDCGIIKIYLQRWLKLLANKLKSIDGKPVSILVQSDVLREIEVMSNDNFDGNIADNTFKKLISSFIVHPQSSWTDYIPYSDHMQSSSLFKFVMNYILLIIAVMIFLKFFKKGRIAFFFVLSTAAFLSYPAYLIIERNTKKLSQIKMAQKQHILSSISSDMCKTYINKNSGIIDHIFDFFRYYYYNEHCQKYYQALMVEPELEVNSIMSFVDLISNAFLSTLPILFEYLNSAVKAGMFNASSFQMFTILLVFFFLLLICARYRIKFPGVTLEPIITGNRVEDLKYSEPKMISNCSCISQSAFSDEIQNKLKTKNNSIEDSSIYLSSKSDNPERKHISIDKETQVSFVKEACSNSFQIEEIFVSDSKNSVKTKFQDCQMYEKPFTDHFVDDDSSDDSR